MILLSEFSEKSKEYYQHKCIKISEEEWQQLFIRSKLPFTYLPKILERWTQDGFDAPKVLEAIDKWHYSLGNAYQKEIIFLQEQGKYRIKRSEKGKASSKKDRLPALSR